MQILHELGIMILPRICAK